MSTVHLRQCDDYGQVADPLRSIWEQMGCAGTVAGKKVLLKANATKGASAEKAVATHPEFTAALVELIREAGGLPYIGDACSIYGFTRESLELAGYIDMAKRLGVSCVPLDSGRVREVRVNGVRLEKTYLSDYVLDADVIISVPKLKPHDHVGLTGAVKNMFGALPGAVKPYLHYTHSNYEHFLQIVLDVFERVRPQLSFMDGIIAMEGQGPTNGTPKKVGLIGASFDAVALDTVFAEATALPKEDLELLRAAEARGLGTYNLHGIAVEGPPIETVRVPLEPAKGSKSKIGLLGRVKYGIRHFGVKPQLNLEHREEIARLAELCPTNAIELNGKPRIKSTCVRCMSCVESCNGDAVYLKVPRWLHATFRKKSPGYQLKHLR